MSNEESGENFEKLFERGVEDRESFEELFEESEESGEFGDFVDTKRSDVDETNTPRGPESRPSFRTKRLAKAQVGDDHTIDLHGLPRHEAKKWIQEFIRDSKSRRIRSVRIITGRGLGLKEGPVIKPMTEELLEGLRHQREIVHFVLENTGGSFIVQLS